MKTDPIFSASKTNIIDSANRTRYFRSTTINLHLTEANAPSIFNKLSLQGSNLLRYVVFWEDIEPTEGKYNEEFLAELRTVLKIASEYNIFVILEPTVATINYSENKYTLPKWILQKLNISENQDLPQTSNPYNSYVFETFFTLFFGGNRFAKEFKIDGDNAQDFLQEHYIEAVYHLTRRLKDCDSIVGMNTMADLQSGFIGIKDLSECTIQSLEKGITSSPFEQIKLASGLPATFSKFTKHSETQKITANIQVLPEKNIVENNGLCLWAKLGIWENPDNKPTLLKPDYFFTQDDLITPFESDLIERIQKKHSHYLFFSKNIACSKIELKTPFNFVLSKEYNGDMPNDGGFFKKANHYLKNFVEQSLNVAKNAKIPLIFYDNQDFSAQDKKQISSYFEVLNKNKASAFVGNQDSFSKIKAYPYPVAIAGNLVDFTFDEKSCMLQMEWDSTVCPTGSGDADTEIFLPKSFFTNGWNVDKFDGVGILREDVEQQRLFVKTLQEKRCYLKLSGK